jgi:hypothetical protein
MRQGSFEGTAKVVSGRFSGPVQWVVTRLKPKTGLESAFANVILALAKHLVNSASTRNFLSDRSLSSSR